MASRSALAGSAGSTNRRWLLGFAVAAVAVATTLEPGMTNDAWWHLALGRWTLENRTVPLVDPFPTLREGTFWVRSGWLADVAMYALYRDGGQAFVRFATSAIVAITTLGLWWRCRGPLVLRVVVVGTAALALNAAAVPRPLVLALPLLVVTEAILARERSSSTPWLWILPALAALWANVHGTFVLVPGLLALDVAAVVAGRRGAMSLRQARRLCGVLVLTLMATFVNPFGWRILTYPIEVGRLTSLGLIEEWQATLRVFPESLLYVVMATTAAWVAWRHRDWLHVGELARLVLFAGAGLVALRHVALLAIVAAPVVSDALGVRDEVAGSSRIDRLGPPPRDSASRDVVFDAGVLFATMAATALLAAGTSSLETIDRTTAAAFPVEAAAAVEEFAPVGSRIYHPYGWGGYLVWRWEGEYGTFVDGRTELFGDELVHLTVNIARASPGWEQALSRYDTHVILARSGSPLDVAASQRWRLVYRDDVAVVYERAR